MANSRPEGSPAFPVDLEPASNIVGVSWGAGRVFMVVRIIVSPITTLQFTLLPTMRIHGVSAVPEDPPVVRPTIGIVRDSDPIKPGSTYDQGGDFAQLTRFYSAVTAGRLTGGIAGEDAGEGRLSVDWIANVTAFRSTSTQFIVDLIQVGSNADATAFCTYLYSFWRGPLRPGPPGFPPVGSTLLASGSAGAFRTSGLGQSVNYTGPIR